MMRILDKFLIHFFLFLTLSPAVFSSDWKFETEPRPWIIQAGNFVSGNTLIFKINERTCNGKVPRMQMFITSYLSDALKQAEGSVIEAKVFTQAKDGEVVYTKKMHIKSTFSFGKAIGIIDPSVSDAMGVAVLEVSSDFPFWPLYKLPGMEAYFPKAHINLSFSDTEIFDLQHETWTISGITKALHHASQYCLKTYGISIKGFGTEKKKNFEEDSPVFNDGAGNSYRGEVKGEIAHGRGTYTYATGEVRTGLWDNGVMIKGTAYYVDDGHYIGHFKDSARHGRGTFFYPDGGKYVGEWRNNMRVGNGTHTTPSGSGFSGIFKNNVADGRGFMFEKDNERVVGEVKNGEWIPD